MSSSSSSSSSSSKERRATKRGRLILIPFITSSLYFGTTALLSASTSAFFPLSSSSMFIDSKMSTIPTTRSHFPPVSLSPSRSIFSSSSSNYLSFAGNSSFFSAHSLQHNSAWLLSSLRFRSMTAAEKSKRDSYLKRSKKQKGPPPKPLTNDEIRALDLRDSATPLWKMSYEEQLQHKQEYLLGQLKSLQEQLTIREPKGELATLYHNQILASFSEGLPCPFEGVLASPSLTGYRNKWQLSVGRDVDGNKGFGFVLGSWTSVNGTIGSIEDCLHVTEEVKHLSKRLNEFVRESKYDIYDSMTKKGFWRLVTIRQNIHKELLLAIQVNPTDLSPEENADAKRSFCEFIEKINEEFKPMGAKTVSVMWQEHSKESSVASPNTPYEQIFGTEQFYEYLCGMKFNISADAFFQTNTKGAEVLYTKVAEWCGVLPSEGYSAAGTVIYDICCGTGSIGLSLASLSQNPHLTVIGVDSVPSAIQDAKRNAAENNFANTLWYAGLAERELPRLFHEEEKKFPRRRLVGVIDPPRPGLHKSALKAIKKCRGLERLVYVSCNAETLISNAIQLCNPDKGCRLPPFRPVKAIGVDLFPHTDHVEAIMLLERCKYEHIPREGDSDDEVIKKEQDRTEKEKGKEEEETVTEQTTTL